ncbi:hypothetical protein OS21_23580 [Dickeya oryzae]
MLGKLLGDTIKDALGANILERVETIRKLSKASRAGSETHRQELLTTLQNLSNEELLPVARAFSQFLNLTNTAEQYHSISPHGEAASNPEALATVFRNLKSRDNLSDKDIRNAVESLSIELVLTAHPTEITRRTLIHKLVEVNTCLKQLDHNDLADYERHQIMRRLRQLIAQYWHTDEIRKIRPTPVDEAKWGFAVVENSLWEGVPAFLRELDEQMDKELGYRLPVDSVPVRFTSWMGGDRDGNPNVTSEITRRVLLLSRWKAADLFLRDVQVLVSELSMTTCTPKLQQLAGGDEVQEPYRELMKKLACAVNHHAGLSGRAPEGRTAGAAQRSAGHQRPAMGTALCLLPVAACLRHGDYRRWSIAGYAAPGTLLWCTTGAHRRASGKYPSHRRTGGNHPLSGAGGL